MKRLLTILSLFIALYSHATNYYASSSGSGSGCTIGSPCTFATAITHGAAGDSILLKKGNTFTGTFTYSHSGSSGNPIVFDAYGNGTNPVIDGGGSTSNRTLVFNVCSFIKVNNIVVQNSFVAAYGTLFISGCHDIAVHNCYVNQGYRGIHAQMCSGNIVIDNCYVTNISHLNGASTAGPASGDGSHIQLDTCVGPGFAVTNNFVWVQSPNPGVGDLISMFKVYGTSGSYVQITGNQSQGGSQGTNGYDGIGVGDVGGQYQLAQNNLIANSGYAGIQIPGGSFIIVQNNKIYSAKNNFPGGTGSLKGMTCYSAFGATPTNITAQNNFLNWRDYNNNVNNLYVEPGVTTPTGWATNTPNSTPDPLAPSTIVPNPLWTGSPWNSPIISYSSGSYLYSTGVGVTNTPTNTGTGGASWTCSPTLPAGLSINSGTGVITGTPTTAMGLTTYIVYATNANGTGTATFTITVNSSGGGGTLFFTSGHKLVTRF